MSTKKKTTLIIVAVIVVGLGAGIFYLAKGGFTAKQRYNNCAETCEDLMMLSSSIPFCLAECEEITGYSPTAADKEKEEETSTTNTGKRTTNLSSNTSLANTSATNTTTDQNTNTVSAEDYEDREYYCEWSWPQKIIDKETSEIIYSCSSDQPWCNHADNSYQNAGCCSDQEHLDCTLLPDLLNN